MYALGIDGGGSQTRALLCDMEGQFIARGLSGSTNPRTTSPADLKTHLHEVIRQVTQGIALSHISAVHLGIAGVSDSETRAIINPIARECLDAQSQVTIGHDLEIAQVGSLGAGEGIVLIAGTGSACYGRNSKGQSIEVGGWGDLVDDVGSGNWIGMCALQSCVRQADGRLPGNALKSKVMEFLQIETMQAFKTRLSAQGLTRSERAALAPIVIDLAKYGDPTAAQIVSRAVEELCELVTTAERQVKLSNPDIFLTGGLIQNNYFSESLSKALKSVMPSARIARPHLDAVAGAVLLALKSAQVAVNETTIHNIKMASVF